MTSVVYNMHEFLVLSYPELGFIINRDQIFASVFLEESQEMESDTRYLTAQMQFNEHTLPVFDLEHYIKDVFDCQNESLLNVALIVDRTIFNADNQETYADTIIKQYSYFSEQYLALKVNVNAVIKGIALSEVRLIPIGIREVLQGQGILGCRFPESCLIHYWLDFETIIINCVSGKAIGLNKD
ncbi:MAG: hypothetical protein OMM_02524 [Candidatus Magnetoglobus multicellularis str. Araruama]|uniref:CheW-like domain-containing protein n=1 Tax=Candidatus Magnetoglobus multicellularis str. Araruama TaxID=890399 RepID=A0A1V1P9E3_9BACT|nr:MAG: hypothetical protein OMM_02524 [Candidatus Magnetoglobus multicellularis str. Araruama]